MANANRRTDHVVAVLPWLALDRNMATRKCGRQKPIDRSQLDRRGWKYDDLVAGDYVIVTGRVAFDGSNRLQLLTIVRPSDGWEGIGCGAD